jgi:hypothetical protein
MNKNVGFEMVCGDCGSLAVKIENPEHASREAIIYCADCGAWRGTLGALRDLAVQPHVHGLAYETSEMPRRTPIAAQ